MAENRVKKNRADEDKKSETTTKFVDSAMGEGVIEESSEVTGADAGETDLEKELAAARAEALENHDKMLRMIAECENLRKRMQRERENSLKYAEENILKELLPAVDNLERAMEQGKTSKDVAVLLEGLELTLKGFIAVFEKFGLKPIESLGEPFDPNLHEAMAMEASKEVPEQRIMQVYEKGYLYKDRLIRAAKVVVSKGDV